MGSFAARARERLTDTVRDAREWARGRFAVPRIPLTLFLAYLLVRVMLDLGHWHIVSPLNLGIHELGHLLFAVGGQFVGIAGGSLLQCIVPCIGIAMFVRQRDYYAIGVGICWLGLNFCYVAWYLGDARSMAIPLVSLGRGDVIHDWNYLLRSLGLLRWDGFLSFCLGALGWLVILLGLVVQGWLLVEMLRTQGARPRRVRL